MRLTSVTVGPVEEHCYLLGDESTREAVLIDPGDEPARILAMIKESGCTPLAIVNTHGHADHIGAVEAMKREFHIPFWLHEEDMFLLPMLPAFNTSLGLGPAEIPKVDQRLTDGQVVRCGTLSIHILHTPGHTPGGVCLYLEAQGVLIAGDTLFAGSVGRTDLPGGSHDRLLESIHRSLLTLPDSVMVHCGHGPSTTIGRERLRNPFLMAHAG